MNLKPLQDRLLVKRIEIGEQVKGGIIIPDTAKEKPFLENTAAPKSRLMMKNT